VTFQARSISYYGRGPRRERVTEVRCREEQPRWRSWGRVQLTLPGLSGALAAMEPSMSDSQLFYSILSVVILTAIILINLRERNAPSNPISAKVWTEHRSLMNFSMVFLGLLVLFSISDLAIHFGVLPASARDTLLPVLGIPTAILSIWVLVLAARTVFKKLRPSV